MRAILTYHSLDGSGSPISVAPDVFERHLGALASRGVRGLTVPDLLAAPPAHDAVAITFDDGFANFATEAWPRLADRGFSVTLFVPTAHVGATALWNASLRPALPVTPLLDWDSLGRLAEAGVAIESHARSHRDLRTLGAEELRAEVLGAADDLEQHLGRRPTGLAYPYGGCDARVAAAAAGIARWACTTRFRALGAGDPPHRLPRLDAWYFGPRELAGWATTAFRARARMIGARRAVGSLVRAVGGAR